MEKDLWGTFSMKTDTVFKRAFNDAVELVSKLTDGEPLPSETALSSALRVSRTTVRKIIATLAAGGVIAGTGRKRTIRSTRRRMRRFRQAETVAASAQLERKFMEWMLREDAPPGALISELELARRFGVANTGIREFLNRFQRFGLIEKQPNGRWVLHGFTPSFALELFEIREMFEMRSATAFASLPLSSALWRQIEAMREEHLALLGAIDARYHDFSNLDSRFHRLINSAVRNRFIDGFYDIFALIFHYHYQWNKVDERQRNEVALREHLAYIDALLSRDAASVRRACKAHLTSAKKTLIQSTSQYRPQS
jgi:DNA-binding GntR family transcriptional regulator